MVPACNLLKARAVLRSNGHLSMNQSVAALLVLGSGVLVYDEHTDRVRTKFLRGHVQLVRVGGGRFGRLALSVAAPELAPDRQPLF